jgi:hypothetical protein
VTPEAIPRAALDETLEKVRVAVVWKNDIERRTALLNTGR